MSNSNAPERIPAGVGAVVPKLQVVGQDAAPESNEKTPPHKNERDIHRHALEYYYLLGKDRTLEKVAQKYGVALDTVQKWSAAFNWKNRVRAFEERGFAIECDARVNKIIDLALHSMTMIDPETGEEVINKKEYSPEKLRSLYHVRILQREEIRKGDPEPPNPGDGPGGPTKGSAKSKGGMMVNANFT